MFVNIEHKIWEISNFPDQLRKDKQTGTKTMAEPNLLASILKEETRVVKRTNTVYLVVDSDTIAWVVLDAKSRPVNVMDLEFVDDLNSILDRVEELTHPKPVVKLVVFVSAKKDSFFVGADITGIYSVLGL